MCGSTPSRSMREEEDRAEVDGREEDEDRAAGVPLRGATGG